jgi:hypothetical protein
MVGGNKSLAMDVMRQYEELYNNSCIGQVNFNRKV